VKILPLITTVKWSVKEQGARGLCISAGSTAI